MPHSTFFYSIYSTHRLPKLTLASFSGNILDGQSFRNSCESAVHLNISLTDVQRFNYQNAQFIGEALQSITGFALTNVNYVEAVNLLKKRFGRPDKITQAYIKALLEMQPPRNNLTSLKQFSIEWNPTSVLVKLWDRGKNSTEQFWYP